MRVIVVYDIANPKRLRRVARVMEDYGDRVQRSVFEVEVGKREFNMMVARVARFLVPAEDSVKFFRLCQGCRYRVAVIGAGFLIGDSPGYSIL